VIKYFIFFSIIHINCSIESTRELPPKTFLEFCQKNKLRVFSGLTLSMIGGYLIYETFKTPSKKLKNPLMFIRNKTFKLLLLGVETGITYFPFFMWRGEYGRVVPK
jgi:hypothetical protein